ncbi:MAG: indolepyruvate ferredoxin oxidoreductase subunit alpha [Deltaproteobacteria bacterium]|nr:indolepyruvate ferredoxin oxidoreductase subunit alpha [Candidatus Zymogenaceae bacterium]
MSVTHRKQLLSGNEAIARGAYEAGVLFASAYPGTPSTEILENLISYDGIYCEWSPNEKVALEVGVGACYAGARTLVAMKHVGVNVAADPLFTLSYTGIRGGMVLVTADDPELHSSQNEQDNRNYAKFAKVPMLDPADSQEAKDYVALALDISEQFDTPVLLRSTTRVSHSQSSVSLSEPDRTTHAGKVSIVKDPPKLVMLPANARKRHVVVEERMKRLREFADTFRENVMEINDTDIGIITAGISYQYAKEIFPNASYLKLGMVYPLPEKLIREFSGKVKRLLVIEELDPFIEEQVRAMGLETSGKENVPILGELNPDIVASSLSGYVFKESVPMEKPELPPRPPNMCPGCPHRGIFYALSKSKVFVAGDIGCYTLAFLPPLQAIDTCLCMGASIGHAVGIDKVMGKEGQGKVAAVIGDSTFFHSGITPLIDAAYNKSSATICILDNRTTAMTGAQQNPGTGKTLMGEDTHRVDIPALAKSIGINRVRKVDPYDIQKTREIVTEELDVDEISVIISESPCVLLKGARRKEWEVLSVDHDKCTGCKACIMLGCPAIGWDPEGINGKGKKGRSVIDEMLCIGCTMCQQLCKFDAIVKVP